MNKKINLFEKLKFFTILFVILLLISLHISLISKFYKVLILDIYSTMKKCFLLGMELTLSSNFELFEHKIVIFFKGELSSNIKKFDFLRFVPSLLFTD